MIDFYQMKMQGHNVLIQMAINKRIILKSKEIGVKNRKTVLKLFKLSEGSLLVKKKV